MLSKLRIRHYTPSLAIYLRCYWMYIYLYLQKRNSMDLVSLYIFSSYTKRKIIPLCAHILCIVYCVLQVPSFVSFAFRQKKNNFSSHFIKNTLRHDNSIPRFGLLSGNIIYLLSILQEWFMLSCCMSVRLSVCLFPR